MDGGLNLRIPRRASSLIGMENEHSKGNVWGWGIALLVN